MCGIAGIVQLNGQRVGPDAIHAMCRVMRHRGPDSEGFLIGDFQAGTHHLFFGDDTPKDFPTTLPYRPAEPIRAAAPGDIALGHRRLTILDLTAAGHQPLCNESGDCWLVYNGEIYNFPSLRAELEQRGHRFVSQTDSEVIVHAYEEWDVECLSRFNGMFAFVLWDARRRRLFGARDRFGVKPFHYLRQNGRFAFASEIKALLTLPDAPRTINRNAVYKFINKSLANTRDETFFEGIHALPPAHAFILETQGFRTWRYWDLPPEIERRGAAELTFEQAKDRFRELFTDSVRLRLVSDVPVGTCLSGGLDSTSIVCTANRLLFPDGGAKDTLRTVAGDRQKTFSIYFDNTPWDERPLIEELAARTGVEKNLITADYRDFLNDLDALVWHQEEPFFSTSVFAQWRVMRRVRERGVTVVLDGQGSDEVLSGYHSLRKAYLAHLLRSGSWRLFRNEFSGFIRNHGGNPKSLLRDVAMNLLTYRNRERLRGWRRRSLGEVPLFPPDVERESEKAYLRENFYAAHFKDPLRNALYWLCTVTHLPALLRHEDRNSMAYSIESRVPFLDYRLVEYVFSLPSRHKMRGGWTKALLREAMRGELPESIRARRDKMALNTPEGDWLRASRAFIEDLFASASFRERGLFRVEAARQAYEQVLQGNNAYTKSVWGIISVELWARRFIDMPGS